MCGGGGSARGVPRGQAGASDDRDPEGRVAPGRSQAGQDGHVDRRDQRTAARATHAARRRMQTHRTQIPSHGMIHQRQY